MPGWWGGRHADAGPCTASPLLPHRNRERERRAHSHLAPHPDPPAMQLDEPPRQGQAEAGALDLLGRRPDLPELLEDGLLIFWGDADPGIRDRHLNGTVQRYGPDV